MIQSISFKRLILFKYGCFALLILGIIFSAYQTAQNKIESPVAISSLHLGMTIKQLESTFGKPSARTHNFLTYILDDGSELFITLRDNVISSANIKFQRLLKIQDPEMRKLTLVQMESQIGDQVSWFFAGKPEEGLIYKITSEGVIEGLTWVPPFTYHNRPKDLQALLQDFRNQQVSKM